MDFGAGPLGMNISARAWQLAHDSSVSKKLLKFPQLLANIQNGALTVVDKIMTGGQAEAAKVRQAPGDQIISLCSDNLWTKQRNVKTKPTPTMNTDYFRPVNPNQTPNQSKAE